MKQLRHKINWLIVVYKTILLCTLSIALLYLNQLIFFLTWGSGAGASRVSELWYIDFLFNYSPLILLVIYLLFIIINSKKNRFVNNLIVLFLLFVFYFYRYNFLDLFIQ